MGFTGYKVYICKRRVRKAGVFVRGDEVSYGGKKHWGNRPKARLCKRKTGSGWVYIPWAEFERCFEEKKSESVQSPAGKDGQQ